MAKAAKQKIGTLYKVAAFLCMILLGYLGLRSYKMSVETLKSNACIDEVGALMQNIQQFFQNQVSYKGLDYKFIAASGIIPKNMFREGFNEALNSYMGGVDVFYSSLSESQPENAFEISFQGLSSFGCQKLIKIDWSGMLIAVAGYPVPTPSGVLDNIYPGMDAKKVRKNIFLGTDGMTAGSDRLEAACACRGNICSVVWKFR